MVALPEGHGDVPEPQFHIIPVANCDTTMVGLDQRDVIYPLSTPAVSLLLKWQEAPDRYFTARELQQFVNSNIEVGQLLSVTGVSDALREIWLIDRMRRLSNEQALIERSQNEYLLVPGYTIRHIVGREIAEFQTLALCSGLSLKETVARCLEGLPLAEGQDLSHVLPRPLPGNLALLSVIDVELPDEPAIPMTDIWQPDQTVPVLSLSFPQLQKSPAPQPIGPLLVEKSASEPASVVLDPKSAPAIVPKPATPRPKPTPPPRQEVFVPPAALPKDSIHPSSLVYLAREKGDNPAYYALRDRDRRTMNHPTEQQKLKEDLKRYVYEGLLAARNRALSDDERASKTVRLAGALKLILEHRIEQNTKIAGHYKGWELLREQELRRIADESSIFVFMQQMFNPNTARAPQLLAAAMRSGIVETLFQQTKDASLRSGVDKKMHGIAAAIRMIKREGNEPTLAAVAERLELPQEQVAILHKVYHKTIEWCITNTRGKRTRPAAQKALEKFRSSSITLSTEAI
ncbi:MAG TPA: hypothetical protein VF733_01945 [Candidatus Saccharimonadales bacterium]